MEVIYPLFTAPSLSVHLTGANFSPYPLDLADELASKRVSR